MKTSKMKKKAVVTNWLMNYNNRLEKMAPYDFTYKLKRPYNVNVQVCPMMNKLLI